MKSVIGIDPGGRSTGIVLMVDGLLLDFHVIERKGKEPLPGPAYLVAVVGTVLDMMLDRESGGEVYPYRAPLLIAVEGIEKPKSHIDGKKRFLDPLALAGTAAVYGHVIGTFGTIVVPPGGNGSKPFFAYPEAIRPKPGGKGSDKLRHARSAWDVALAGLTNSVLRSAQAPGTMGR